VIEVMKEAYPELVQVRDTIARVIRQEETGFAETLSSGLADFYDRAARAAAAGARALSGEDAFFLYDTRGLPLEIIEDLALEKDLVVDLDGFNRALEEQRDRSRQDYQAGKVREEVAETIFEGRTSFVGYGYREPARGRIVAMLVDGEPASAMETGQKGEIVLDATPFYAEAGGQVGDTGQLTLGLARARILDTQYRGTTISHVAEIVSGRLEVGDEVEAAVDLEKRRLTMKNHTATHLLHAALKNVLGPHVKQAGSLVAPDRLRFDFTHFAPLTPAEITAIEDAVNTRIWLNIPVETEVMDLDTAMSSGAVALFGEKYQDRVRVVAVPEFSKELCGGTHVAATGDIGVFKITSQESIAAGVRRIEALTAAGAFARFRTDEELLDSISSDQRVARQEIPSFLERLQGQIRALERKVSELEVARARSGMDQFLASTRQVGGIRVLASEVPGMERTRMRTLADELRQKLGSGVVVLGAPQDGKVALIVTVTKDLADRLPAGKIIREIAPVVGGAGGGKAELAEAGGKDPARLADALMKSYEVVEGLLGAAR
jgi:alanyl-tRNA synthetase